VWGLRPKVVHWLYTSVIRPSVTFASTVWWPGCQTGSAKKLLDKIQIQRLACLGITGAMRTTPTRAMEALIGLPPLELVVQREARSAAHRLWSLGCWSHLHPNRGHSSILIWIQQANPIFKIGVDAVKPVYNLDRTYRVTMLTRREWTKRAGAPPSVKGLVWYTDWSVMGVRAGAGVYGQSARRRPSFPLGRCKTIFQAEIFAILACA
jgi:hypothetical protein